MKSYLAIDPGKTGGIAYNVESATLVTATLVTAMPATGHDIRDVIFDWQNSNGQGSDDESRFLAVVEDVPVSMGNKGAASSKLNRQYGMCTGVLIGMGVPLVLVRPHDWQSHFRLGTRSACASDGAWKNKLKAEAQRRFPHLKVTLDTADALLILAYAREKNL